MRLTYWMKYDRLYKNFSPLEVFQLVRDFANKLGQPYTNTDGRGKKPKVNPIDYAAYIAFQILVKGATYRAMEFESKMFLGKHLDHGTFAYHFGKIPTAYFLDLVEEAGTHLTTLLETSKHYVVDSTAITTPLTFETNIKGKKVVEHIEFKAHAIASIHKKNQCVVIRKALATTKNVADCEGAKIMLQTGTIHHVTLHGDRGFDYERVYHACHQNHIKPNIKPQTYTAPHFKHREQELKKYNDQSRKKHRGIIETIFGGLTNAKLLITRLITTTKICSYAAIMLLRHNIMSILRQC